MAIKPKYLVAFDISGAPRNQIEELSKKVYAAAGANSAPDTLPPHLTVCPPQFGLNERELRKVLREEMKQAKDTTVILKGFHPFGNRNVVLLAGVTRTAARTWMRLSARISELDGYKTHHAEEENILHATVAKMAEDVFTLVWPTIKSWDVPLITAPLSRVVLYSRYAPHANWEVADIFYAKE